MDPEFLELLHNTFHIGGTTLVLIYLMIFGRQVMKKLGDIQSDIQENQRFIKNLDARFDFLDEELLRIENDFTWRCSKMQEDLNMIIDTLELMHKNEEFRRAVEIACEKYGMNEKAVQSMKRGPGRPKKIT